MALVLLPDDVLPALWSACDRVIGDASAPADVREACELLADELVTAGGLSDAARRERDAAGRRLRASRAPAPRVAHEGPREAWERSGLVSVACGVAVVVSALVGPPVAPLLAGGVFALGGAGLVWVAAMLGARRAG